MAHSAVGPMGRCRHVQFLHIVLVGCCSCESVTGVGSGVVQDQCLVAAKGSARDMSEWAALASAWVELALLDEIAKDKIISIRKLSSRSRKKCIISWAYQGRGRIAVTGVCKVASLTSAHVSEFAVNGKPSNIIAGIHRCAGNILAMKQKKDGIHISFLTELHPVKCPTGS